MSTSKVMRFHLAHLSKKRGVMLTTSNRISDKYQKDDIPIKIDIHRGINFNHLSRGFACEFLSELTRLYPEFREWGDTSSELNTRTIVLNRENKTLGVAIFKIKKTGVKLCNFYIAKKERGLGTGKIFGNTITSILSNLFPDQTVYLTVKRETGSKGFYLSLGFSVSGSTDRGEDILSLRLRNDIKGFSGFGILPFSSQYFDHFLLKNGYVGVWRYYSRIANIESFLGNRVLLYVSSPVQSIVGEATLTVNSDVGRVKEVATSDSRKDALSAFLLSDFILYPEPMGLHDLICVKALIKHPQRLHHLPLDRFEYIRKLGLTI